MDCSHVKAPSAQNPWVGSWDELQETQSSLGRQGLCALTHPTPRTPFTWGTNSEDTREGNRQVLNMQRQRVHVAPRAWHSLQEPGLQRQVTPGLRVRQHVALVGIYTRAESLVYKPRKALSHVCQWEGRERGVLWERTLLNIKARRDVCNKRRLQDSTAKHMDTEFHYFIKIWGTKHRLTHIPCFFFRLYSPSFISQVVQKLSPSNLSPQFIFTYFISKEAGIIWVVQEPSPSKSYSPWDLCPI